MKYLIDTDWIINGLRGEEEVARKQTVNSPLKKGVRGLYKAFLVRGGTQKLFN